MQRHFNHIETLTEIGEVLSYLCDRTLEVGATRFAYYVIPQFENPTSSTTMVFTHGFDEEWLALYDDQEFRLTDPIPDRVLEFGALMTWQDAIGWKENSVAEQSYFVCMRDFGLVDGFGIPLYGRNGRDAYAVFDFLRHVDEVEPDAVGLVRSLAQAAHQRISILAEHKHEGPTLSDRETEVLLWVARGKSISSVATILELSPDTIKTYLRRIYAKLDASDRVGAVVKALKLGLVKV